ncbi:YggT family protein [Candidatus Palibaumannia cicadellinicola]|uniref:Integral membrane protein YggT, involved in response to extracytoplasmic stress (Osmotic shock) n=1 Tax=Candidatus Palibaumannia cicadellinicola TaxID=186490 RepID=A0A088MYY0_9GAMM|nr:YggT family protein [Candidatus Baumannia cicadellinicola]AIN47399.1 Integral membrane protein YggT, involved in response to extracytoplasmic stress (osmotic shock) [Candidatus Baumannia cicadellinicola]
MLTLTLIFLVKIFIDFYIKAILLRVWIQWAHCDFYHQLTKIIVQLTQLLVNLTYRIISPLAPLDKTLLFLGFILACIKFPLLKIMIADIPTLDSIYLLVGILTLVKAIIDLVFWVMIIHSLLTWISPSFSPINIFFYQLSELLLSRIRLIIPVISGIDLSTTIIIMFIYLINSLLSYYFPEIWVNL